MLGHIANLILEVTDEKKEYETEKAAEKWKQELLHDVAGKNAVEIYEHIVKSLPHSYIHDTSAGECFMETFVKNENENWRERRREKKEQA